jgi:hypothetical protein
MRNVLPVPGELDTSIAPPLCRTIPCTIERPRPVPDPRSFVVKNGSKTSARVSASCVGHEVHQHLLELTDIGVHEG